jgi:hypothetical protein
LDAGTGLLLIPTGFFWQPHAVMLAGPIIHHDPTIPRTLQLERRPLDEILLYRDVQPQVFEVARYDEF